MKGNPHMSGSTSAKTKPASTSPTEGDPSDEETPPTTPTGADTNPADEDEDEPGDEGPQLTFTSKALKERNDRIKRKEHKAILDQLGVKNLDEAKEKFGKLTTLESEKLTNEQKLEKERDDARKEAVAATRKAEKLAREKAEQEATSFMTKAAESAGVDTDAMDLVLSKLAKHIEDSFDDEDDVTEDALKPFFKQLKSEKKLWFAPKETQAKSGGKETTSPATPGGRPVPPKPVRDMTPEEYKAHKVSRGLR